MRARPRKRNIRSELSDANPLRCDAQLGEHLPSRETDNWEAPFSCIGPMANSEVERDLYPATHNPLLFWYI